MKQIKQLQITLEHHPKQNALTALQFSLHSFFSLLLYIMTFTLSAPDQFQWTTAITLLAIIAAGVLYTVFLRQSS